MNFDIIVNKKLNWTILLVAVLAIVFQPLTILGQYDVVLGTDNVPIQKVGVTRNGVYSIQTLGNQSTIATTDKVMLDSIVINDGGTLKTLSYTNFDGAHIVNNNFTTEVEGVGVYNQGLETPASDILNWNIEMAGVVSNRNLLQYLYYDHAKKLPKDFDFDIRWSRGISNDDYFVVSERNGNTYFTVTPLGIDGNPIPGARSLRFGKKKGAESINGNDKYDWNIRYASEGRSADQPQYMTVIRMTLFNTPLVVYGLRIDNKGDADVKFYAFSDNSFIDNPINPKVAGLTGNVFNDLNGSTDSRVNGNPIHSTDGNDLYVSLVQNGVVKETKLVQPDGGYQFLHINAGPYYTVLHSNPNGSLTPSLSNGWVNTGEHHGTDLGTDGFTNGVSPLVIVGDSLETEVNFGIVALPNTMNKYYTLDPSPIENSVRQLISIHGLGKLDGDDPSGVTFGQGSKFVIKDTTGMAGNVLFYDVNGNNRLDAFEELLPNDTIQSYDPNKLSVSFNGINTTGFTFAYASVNAAGFMDITPANYSATWSAALPVTWLSFELSLEGRKVNINWSTASEVNNSHFVVEHSSDLINWSALGTVIGNGNTTHVSHYTFADETPNLINYYRIKQIDFNGSIDYSSTKSIQVEKSFKISNYPNPAINTINIHIDSEEDELVSIDILDNTGKVRLQHVMNSSQTSINISSLKAGVYYIKAKNELLKFVKL